MSAATVHDTIPGESSGLAGLAIQLGLALERWGRDRAAGRRPVDVAGVLRSRRAAEEADAATRATVYRATGRC